RGASPWAYSTSGAQPPSGTPAPHEASPRPPFAGQALQASPQELTEQANHLPVFLDMGDAQRRIGLFIDAYNFQRPNQGIDGLVPADRYFGAASEVLKTLKTRVAANA